MKDFVKEFMWFTVIVLINSVAMELVGWWPETAVAYLAGAYGVVWFRKESKEGA